MKIGIIGAGKMGLALARGVVQSQPQCALMICDPSEEAIAIFRASLPQAEVVPDNQSVCAKADVVFVCCKPQQLKTAIPKPMPSESAPLFISILAGTTVETLQSVLGTKRVIRVMPNTPCLIGKGVMGVAVNASLPARDQGLAELLLGGVGTVVEVEESLLDAVTGISGSGPAYVYKFMEAMIQSGVQAGLSSDVARTLVMETVIGAGEMVKMTGEEPGDLRDHVSSPGGTTIAGLSVMEQLGFEQVVDATVKAAIARSRELADH